MLARLMNIVAGRPWRTLVTAGLAALIYLVFGPAHGGLIWTETGVRNHELLRFVSGHFTHADPEHLLWNLGGLLVLGFLFERRLGRRYFPLLIFGGMLPLGVWLLFGASLQAYCGLSGLLNTLLAGGLVAERRAGHRVLPVVVGILALMKILVEMVLGSALFTSTVWPPVPMAHLIGFVSGWLFMRVFREKSDHPAGISPLSRRNLALRDAGFQKDSAR